LGKCGQNEGGGGGGGKLIELVPRGFGATIGEGEKDDRKPREKASRTKKKKKKKRHPKMGYISKLKFLTGKGEEENPPGGG